jgi:hypothetical protein
VSSFYLKEYLMIPIPVPSLAHLVPADMTTMLNTANLRKYLRDTKPTFSHNKDTYELRWNDAVVLQDGTRAALCLHMHEWANDANRLSGGGAWIDGGAANHDVNIDNIGAITHICLDWLNEHYEEEFTL